MNSDTARGFIERVLDSDHDPCFYVVGGSSIYGFASNQSDVDIRGFHCADGKAWMSLTEPDEQVAVNQGTVTDGFDDHPEVEVVSYELKKFASLLNVMNFNIVEWVLHGEELMNDDPLAIDTVRQIVTDYLPGPMPEAYRGMAKQNRKRYLQNGPVKAKRYLYVIRGLLAAEYVDRFATVEPDVTELAQRLRGQDVVHDLIDHRRSTGGPVDSGLHTRAQNLIMELTTSLDIETSHDKEAMREDLNDWMYNLRDI